MKIESSTEPVTHKLTLTLSDEELRDLLFIVGFDITIPESVSDNPRDPRRLRTEKMLRELHAAIAARL